MRKLKGKAFYSMTVDRKVLVPLTAGLFATIDVGDFRTVVKHGWCAIKAHGTWYAQANVKVDGKWKRIFLHRLLVKVPPGMQVDHKDRNGLNCARGNLRIATRSSNQKNTGRKNTLGRTSRYKGVCWANHLSSWVAQCVVGGKNIMIGQYDSEEDAALAYDHCTYHQNHEFSLLNFPELVDQYAKTPWERKKKQSDRREKVGRYCGTTKRGLGWAVACGRFRYLGVYETEEVAAAVYDVAAICLRGPGTALNFPDLRDAFMAIAASVHFDETPREEMRTALLAEVRSVLAERGIVARAG